MPNYSLHILTPLSKVIHVAHQDFWPVLRWISIYFCIKKFELGLDYSKLIMYFWKKINSRIFFKTLHVKITQEFFMGNHFWYETDSIWGRVVPLIFQGSIYFNDRDNFREKKTMIFKIWPGVCLLFEVLTIKIWPQGSSLLELNDLLRRGLTGSAVEWRTFTVYILGQ